MGQILSLNHAPRVEMHKVHRKKNHQWFSQWHCLHRAVWAALYWASPSCHRPAVIPPVAWIPLIVRLWESQVRTNCGEECTIHTFYFVSFTQQAQLELQLGAKTPLPLLFASDEGVSHWASSTVLMFELKCVQPCFSLFSSTRTDLLIFGGFFIWYRSSEQKCGLFPDQCSTA